jgi:hypothetical protein
MLDQLAQIVRRTVNAAIRLLASHAGLAVALLVALALVVR